MRVGPQCGRGREAEQRVTQREAEGVGDGTLSEGENASVLGPIRV